MRASSSYRRDIDGIRAIAVSLVLAFHAFPAALPGGFVGVDVFFVISGFLITGIIRDQKELGTFSLVQFYERRIRRIFPALIIVLGFTFASGWFLFLPTEFAQLGVNTIAGTAFFANIALLVQSGYFDIEAAKKPLLHLWSLGIEEQFYIAWPLLLMLASRFRNGVIWMIAVVGAASFVLNLYLVSRHPDATFYLPFSRAWELLLGALITYTRIDAGKLRDLSSVAGLGLILAAALIFTTKIEFPGWRAALPVAGTALLIISSGSLLNHHLLSNRFLVGIGLISYPLYLWHWPLLVFGPLAFDGFDDVARLVALAISVVLAWATWRFIERPVRAGGSGTAKVLSLGSAVACIAAVGAWTVQGAGLDFRIPSELRTILHASEQTGRWRTHKCSLIDGETDFADECVDQGRRPLIFVWGDSTSAALMPGLRDLQQKREFGLAQFSTSSCEPALTDAVSPYCLGMNRKVLAKLADIRPDTVLLEAIWNPTHERIAGLIVTINAIKKLGIRHIVVLGRVPVWEGGLPQQIFNYYQKHLLALPTRLPTKESLLWTDGWMRERLDPLGVTFVSAWDSLCNPKDGCLVRLPDSKGRMDLVATDLLHLSEAGSAYLISAIEPSLFPPD